MGKKLFFSNLSNVTVELCREWIGKFLQGMLDAGFVQTADAGQVDPATVELSATVGSTVYAMFRFDDHLQSSDPVFVKVEFSNSSNTANTSTSGNHGAFISVGRATDGNGVLGGTLLARTGFGAVGLASSIYSTTAQFTHAAFSGPGYLGVIGFVDDTRTSGSSRSYGFIVERARTASGDLDAAGLMVYRAGEASSVGMTGASASESAVYAINYATGRKNSGGVPVATLGTVDGTALGPTTSLASGSIGPVFPWDVVAPGLSPWRSCVAISLPAGDIPGGVFRSRLCTKESFFYPVPPSTANARYGIAVTESGGISRYFGVGVRWED